MNSFDPLWQSGGAPLVALIIIGSWCVGAIVHESVALALRFDRPRGALPILGALGAVAPLVGLLGTVMALVLAFESGVTPHLVAASISQALITTQVGLVIAIPTLVGREALLRWRERLKARGVVG